MSSSSSDQYPTQKHAGKADIGPYYHPEPTLGEKLTGFKEEAKGKIHRDEAQVQHGKDIVSGEEKRRANEQDAKTNPLKNES